MKDGDHNLTATEQVWHATFAEVREWGNKALGSINLHVITAPFREEQVTHNKQTPITHTKKGRHIALIYHWLNLKWF